MQVMLLNIPFSTLKAQEEQQQQWQKEKTLKTETVNKSRPCLITLYETNFELTCRC